MSKIDELVPEDLGTNREKEIGQHIGYRYDVNLVPDYDRITPFLKKYLDMIARELLIKFQMSKRHPMVVLRDNYGKF